MSAASVEAVRAIYECWEHGDFDTPWERLTPDFEWRQESGVVVPGAHVGAEADRALRSILEVYDEYRIEAEEFVEVGEKVVVVARASGTARLSGARMESRSAHVWTLADDGRAARIEQYRAREEALEAAGSER